MSDTETTLRGDLLALCNLAEQQLEGHHWERCCGGDPRECIAKGDASWRPEAEFIDRVRSRILAEWPEPAKEES